MSRAASVDGVVGQIKWGYYMAAAINGYTVTRSPEHEWSLRGTVVLADAFKVTQRPLTFIAPHANGEWRWPIRDLRIHEGQVTASLGPPEEG